MEYYLILLLCILLSCVVFHVSRTRKPKLPPGPTALPIVGNLFDLGTNPHRSLAKLAKIHGPVMSLQLGRQRSVIISSASAAKQVLQKSDSMFCNRSIPDALTACQHHDFSVVFLPVSDQWRSFRKICNSHMFTTARLNASQHLRSKKLEDLLSYVESCKREGKAIEIGQAAFNTSLNLLSNTFFSVDLVNPGSSNSQEYKETVWQIMVEAGKPNLSDYFPILRRIDPQGIRRRMEIHFGKMMNLFNGLISQRLAEKGGRFDEINDTLDALLKIS